MMEDELIRIWQSSPQEERIKFDKSRLILDMQSSLNRFDKLAKYGILSEQIAGAVIIPVLAYYVYWVPFLLSKIASVLIAIWGIWYMFRLRKFKKAKPTRMTENYLDYLYQCRKYIAILKRMSETAIFWYIGPIILGGLLFISGPIIAGELTGKKMVVMLSSILGTGVLSYFYLKWITKTQYTKRLEKIDKLIEVMQE